MGDNEEEWKAYDATELAASTSHENQLPILIDQGSADDFYGQKQLLPEAFEAAVKNNSKSGLELTLRFQDGYDHGYYFVQTFINNHLLFHAKYLLPSQN